MDAATLALLRADASKNRMPDTGQLLEPALTNTNMGQRKGTPIDHGTYPIFIRALTGEEKIMAAGLAADATYKARMPHNAPLDVTYYVHVTNHETGATQDFQILWVDRSSMSITQQMLCKEYNPQSV